MPRTIVITGASDGIGAAAAAQLSGQGDQLVLVGRSPAKTAAVAARLGADHRAVDFADLSQVRRLAQDLAATYPRIDVLANNAGGIFGAREQTRDGLERTLQVNHLAPFLLTTLLLPTLTVSGAKVIATSSSAAKNFGKIDLTDLQNERAYSPNKAYGDAKLANILFTKELDRRYRAQGIDAVTFNPGNVATNFASDTTSWFRFIYRTPLKRLALISPQESAKRLVWLINGVPGQTWQRAAYYDGHKVGSTTPQAHDDALARDLWDTSAALV
ncbi:SDR family NAD(P)-dependent oxidoreductase [Quadrisphaera sp. KR29]|uniref:SDR family NAD(P)-dependent oxidoreductase n=1 Tax=Quadrisphaera sp. KR29 TaxID=3461391 RepID=UPI004044C87E